MPKFRTPTLAALGAAGLALAGCDSQAENEVEQQAEALDEAYEADADLTEAYAEGAPEAVQDAAEKEADRLRREGEETKDNLEDMADEMDTSPQ